MSDAVIRVDDAMRALAEAATPEEILDVQNKAEAMRLYARRAKLGHEVQNICATIKLRAMRKGGGMLDEMDRQRQGRPQKGGVTPPFLSDIGIDKEVSRNWRKVAAPPDAVFERYLAGNEELTLAGLFRTAKAATYQPPERVVGETDAIEDLMTLADSGARFAAIYADPPWTFKVYSGKGKSRSAERHYKTMTLDEMKDPLVLPVERLAADDCALFLWAVMPQLPEALELISAWGFTYKTCGFTWVKTYPGRPNGFVVGMGYWTRSNPEVCLLATRGSPKRLNKDVQQLVVAPRGGHSAKPEIVAERVERLVSGPYLELFARRKRDRWAVWGDDIEDNLFDGVERVA